MVTLKEYKTYLKIKKFIEIEGCDEADLIPRLINGVAYIPSIIESEDMEQLNVTLHRPLLRVVGSLNKLLFMPIGIRKRE